MPHRLGADRAAGVGPQGAAAGGAARDQARVAVRVRLRAAGDGRDVLAAAAGADGRVGQRGAVGVARWADPQGKKRLVLVWDGAGGHTAKSLVVPEQVELVALPPYTPELQPVESAWPLLREAVANESFASLEALSDRLVERCRWFMEAPEKIQGVVGHNWAAALNQ